MTPERFLRESRLPVPAREAFDWHERPGAFERLAPPWDRTTLLERTGGIRDGDRAVIGVRVGPIAIRWIAEHRDYRAGRAFTDVQLAGPFAQWEHRHEFLPTGEHDCILRDDIGFVLPLGPLGRCGSRSVRSMLDRMFRYRHATTRDDLAMHAAFAGRPRLCVQLSGSATPLRRSFEALLTTGGHRVLSLPPGTTGTDDRVDVEVHFAAAGVDPPARTCGRRQILVTGPESGADGSVVANERWIGPASGQGCHVRIAPVLHPRRPPLSRLLPWFRAGLGGRPASVRSPLAWISPDDAVGALHHVVLHEEPEPTVVIVAPEPTTSTAIASHLARLLHRPCRVRWPESWWRMLVGGEFPGSDAAEPSRPHWLVASGYRFRHPEIATALRHVLGAR